MLDDRMIRLRFLTILCFILCITTIENTIVQFEQNNNGDIQAKPICNNNFDTYCTHHDDIIPTQYSTTTTSHILMNNLYRRTQITKRLLIVMVYSPGREREDNLNFFLRQGLIGIMNDGIHNTIYHHYVFIINGVLDPTSPMTQLLLYLNHTYKYIEVHQRSNYGNDLCAWKLVLNSTLPDFSLRYSINYFTHVFLMNDSLRGPFIPSWLSNYQDPTIQSTIGSTSSSNTRIVWTNLFLQVMNSPTIPNIRLVGTTINCLLHFVDDYVNSYIHIQSMLLLFQNQDIPLIEKKL